MKYRDSRFEPFWRQAALAAAVLLLITTSAAAQEQRAALRVTVVDQTGAAIVGAALKIVTGGATRDAVTDGRGQAQIADLAVGAVDVRVEFPGFAPHAQQIALRRGANSATVTLRVALEENVTVEEQNAASRRGNSLDEVLDEDDLAGLPDDPDEFEEALRQMAGGDAVFQVNGFRGGRLPPKNQIRQVRFRRNSFAAENHEAGGRVHVDVITKPGLSAWSGGANLGLRDDILNARNAFARTQTPEQFRRWSGNFSGPLKKDRTALFLSVEGNNSYDSQTIVAQLPEGRVLDQVRRPTERAEVTATLEHALSENQTLRLEYQRRDDTRRNLGVGDFALFDRGFTRESAVNQVRTSLQTIVGKSMLNDLKVEFRAEDTTQTSDSAAPAVVVIDAFSRGGAGVASERALKGLQVANDFDFSKGRHALRTGVLFEAGAYRQLDNRNANGTYTFSSLESFLAGRPNTYTQRLGEVQTSFSQYQLGLYFQDDVKVSRDLSLSVGARHEMQNHLADTMNFMPRVGFTWNPFGSKTTLRGGYGLFHDWLDADVYDQSIRVNGVAQNDLLILNPGYPDPYADGSAVVLPGGRVQLSPDLAMPYQHQVSIGAERQFFSQRLTLQGSYLRTKGGNWLRSVNLNAPDADGIRPQPQLGTISQVESTGELDGHRLNVGGNVRLPARSFISMNYVLAREYNHADSPLSLPANSRDLDGEWGPSARDVRHRVFTMFGFSLPKGVRGHIMSQAQSGLPYTITTGRDDNGDGVSNDRPEGVGRNTARGTWRWDLNMRVSRGFGFGGERPEGQGGAVTRSRVGGDDGPMMMAVQQSAQRFRVDFYVQGYNLLNRTNYTNFSGNLQSPFFGRASSAAPARRVEVGMQFGF